MNQKKETTLKKLIFIAMVFLMTPFLFSQTQGEKWNELSTSIFPIEVSYERYLSKTDSVGVEFNYPILLDNWYFGSAVTRFLFEYKRYLFGDGQGFYLTFNTGIGSELKYSSPGQNWRSLSFVPWALTGVYVGGNALNVNRYQIDNIPLNIGFGWKLSWDRVPLDLRVTVGYANIIGYRNDVGQSVGSLSDLPYKTEAYLTNQSLNFLVSPHIGFSF